MAPPTRRISTLNSTSIREENDSNSIHPSTSTATGAPLPWTDLFRSASFRLPNPDPFAPTPENQRHPTAVNSVPHRGSLGPQIIGNTRCFSMDRNQVRSFHNQNSDCSSASDLSWQVMFRSASFRRPELSPRTNNNASPPTLALSLDNHIINPSQLNNSSPLIPPEEHSSPSIVSLDSNHYSNSTTTNPDLSIHPPLPALQASSLQAPNSSPQETHHSCPLQSFCPRATTISPRNNDSTSNINPESDHTVSASPDPSCNPHFKLAFCVTIAQAAVAAIVLLFYSGFSLFEEYLRPILWAAICSVPLRGIQDTLVEFWSEPLKSGLADTILAVPVAISKVLLTTIIDAREVFDWVCSGNKNPDMTRFQQHPQQQQEGSGGFLKLVSRLVSFGIFVLAFQRTGGMGALILLGSGLMFSTSLSESTISTVSSLRGDSFRIRNNLESGGIHQSNKFGTPLTQCILKRLKPILAMGLITGMIIALLVGIFFFSYKIGVEGKDAIISLKSHLEHSNYAEKLGIKKWVDENDFIQVLDRYTNECYDHLNQQIDHLANKYNLTDFLHAIKHSFLTNPSTNPKSNSTIPISFVRFRNLTSIAKELLLFTRQDEVFQKAKCYAAQGVDLSLQALSINRLRFLFEGVVTLLLSVGYSMASVLNTLIQFTVFFWVLYYLLTSESGGITEQIVKMIPSRLLAPNQVIKKAKIVKVLNDAVSGVMLVTVEIAFFQGCLTWLICRLYDVHFVYVSTLLALIGSVLPIFPPWISTLLGVLQLMVLDGRYLIGVGFGVTHLVLMDYGASEIAETVPGYSAYLTGVSIIGGMTLFSSALEGAMMGPLITTVVIALKGLYTEFVLDENRDGEVESFLRA